MEDNKFNVTHIPVMAEEVGNFLNCHPGQTILDCTVGEGGHTSYLISKIYPEGRVIGIDRDEMALEVARSRLAEFGDSIKFEHANFRDLKKIVEKVGGNQPDGILFDLGINSSQIQDSERGFSFLKDGPLDMRMDSDEDYCAADVVNKIGRKELEWIIRNYGEERYAGRISRRIVEERSLRPILRTGRLARIVSEVQPRRGKIHPATRTFQALRIYLNKELEALEEALPQAISILKPGGRICVISFHSLEDRIVKFKFKHLAQKEGLIRILTKKPVSPGIAELQRNPRSRSAKLRAAEKV